MTLAAALSASHRWALERAREALHLALSGHDRSLPPLAAREVLAVEGAAGPLEGRLYRPQGVAENAPLMLFFHGGGFVVSDLDTHEPLCIRLASAAGLRVLAVRYRLAPEHRFPAQLEDAWAATSWVLGQRGLHAERIVLGGDSAGGYLAASVAARLDAEAPGAVIAQLLLYPLLQVDEEVWAATLMRQTRALGWAAVRYIRAVLLEPDAVAPSLLAPDAVARLPTVLAAGGALDPVRHDVDALAESLRAGGATLAFRTYPRLIHGFGNLTHASAEARDAVAEIGAALGEAVRGRAN